MGIFGKKSKIEPGWHDTEYSGEVSETVGRLTHKHCPVCRQRMRKIVKHYKGGGTVSVGHYCEHCQGRVEPMDNPW